MLNIRGRRQTGGTWRDVTVRIHEPLHRPEAGHWVAMAEIGGLGNVVCRWAGDDAAAAQARLQQHIAALFDRFDVTAVGTLPFDLACGCGRNLEKLENSRLPRAIVTILGEQLLPDGSSRQITARIHPPVRRSEYLVEARLDVEGLYDFPIYLPGSSLAQASESCFLVQEEIFAKYDVKMVSEQE